ncbi:MAG: HEAT repeat domain-containing protein [Armatimonadetes bacterium]|nr:HEAT repeat domain-containing protein [Armatimonadota bacterium]
MERCEVQALIDRLAERHTDWTVFEALARHIVRDEHALRAVLDAITSHPNPKVRRLCADLMDHHGDDRCVETLRQALHDPVPRVRRQAVHSLSCQRCKTCALTVGVVPVLTDVALTDENMWVRREAVCALAFQPRDARAAAALRVLLARETDPKITSEVHGALRIHDEEYRRASNAAARVRQQRIDRM